MIINFQNIQADILDAVKTKAGLVGSWTVLDSFANQFIQKEISGNVLIGGPTIPLVIVMNTLTGEIKYFSLKFLLGDKINLN